jgi:DNA-binding NarL/FixJ family response regulator
MLCEVHRGDGERLPAEVWFSRYVEEGAPRLAAIIADISEEQPAGVPTDSFPRPAGTEPLGLNSRQIAVMRQVLEGLSNNQIASRLDITPSAVKHTLEQLFAKTGANNRSQIVRVALERYRGLL